MKKITIGLLCTSIASCASVPNPTQIINETNDGFYIAATYSEYQFFPDTSSVYNECSTRVQSLANNEANKKGKKIKPIANHLININVDRNEFTGITTCTVEAMVSWDNANKRFNSQRAFGTRYGMTKNDITSAGVRFTDKLTNNKYMSSQAPLTNKNFDLYIYSFDKNDNLCQISGLKRLPDINTQNIKQETEKTKDLLADIYGEYKLINKISNKTNWLMNNKGGNLYSYLWLNDKTTDNGILGISLYPYKIKAFDSVLFLNYIFILDCNNTDINGL